MVLHQAVGLRSFIVAQLLFCKDLKTSGDMFVGRYVLPVCSLLRIPRAQKISMILVLVFAVHQACLATATNLWDHIVSSEPADALWRVGVQRVDITPETPIWLSGFSARDRAPSQAEVASSAPALFAKVLVMQKATTSSAGRTMPPVSSLLPPLVLVSLDLIGADADFSSRIFSRLKHELGLDREHVRLCFSHTHSGPVVGEHLQALAPLDSHQKNAAIEYAHLVIAKVVGAIHDAMDLHSVVTARARFAVGNCQLAVNRQQVPETEFDGSNFGLVDHDVPVLWFYTTSNLADGAAPQRRIIAGVFGYAAHATVLTTGYEYYGDYPAETSSILETDVMVGGTWLYLAGAGGDQNIYPRGSRHLCRQHAMTLASRVKSIVEMDGQQVQSEILCAADLITLPYHSKLRKRDLVRWSRSTIGTVSQRMATSMLRRRGHGGIDERGWTSPSYPVYPISVWVLGEVLIVFLGGEPTVGYSRTLKKVLRANWVVGYTDDVMGYVGTTQVLREGGREGSDRAAVYYGLPSRWRLDVEQIIHDAIQGLLVQLAGWRQCRVRPGFGKSLQ